MSEATPAGLAPSPVGRNIAPSTLRLPTFGLARQRSTFNLRSERSSPSADSADVTSRPFRTSQCRRRITLPTPSELRINTIAGKL